MEQIKKTTEAVSRYSNLEQLTVRELLSGINAEDKTVADAVEKVIPQVELLVNAIVVKMKEGGRLFYIGSGTSGRLGVVDASECPPTFGVEDGMVTGLIAGGDGAIRKAVEFAEDDTTQGWNDLLQHNISNRDVVIGITASGTTPYVTGALKKCKEQGVLTGCITCNTATTVAGLADFPVEVITGPEFITGSTRMKAGTAQKMILNMISSSVMIQLGRVSGNRMVDMQLTNEKLIDRGTRMLMHEFAWDYKRARAILQEFGSVRKVMQLHRRKPKA
ncbi:MAG: N-acetylmuramic acid 6-phosphate etherase [Chitinophagales bacterium]|nr:N-acetylmuramic acid 6-phosphate etherase [Chitinophagales bacterium]